MSSKQSYWWSSSSISLSIAIISIYCVVAIPLFPHQRKRNDSSHIFSIIMSIICNTFLVIETRIYNKLWHLWHLMRRVFCQRFRMYENLDVSYEHNYLAYFFFIGYLLSDSWKILNEIYFSIKISHCYEPLALIAYIGELILGILIMVAIVFKDFSMDSTIWSCFGWSCTGAVCFGSAFKFIIEEVTYGYIEIVEISINDPEYGLNITNTSKPEDYVPLIFKLQTGCFEHVLLPHFAEYILELIPFSTEYFSLATFFCFITWKNLGGSHQDPPDELTPLTIHVCNDSCWFTVKKLPALIMAITLIVLTIASIYFFYNEVKYKHHSNGTENCWIFVIQQFIFQLILVMLELPFYLRHMKLMQSMSTPPLHYQLDVILLTFPLLPLGILYVLRAFPDIIYHASSSPNQLTSAQPFYTSIQIILAIFNWTQVLFQCAFISEVFCRIKFGSMRKCANFFLLLAMVNFCIWLSWTFECKLIAIYGRSFTIYGIIEWIMVIYSTVPFVMFCFAHTTACFLEIHNQVLNDITVNPRNVPNRAQSL